MVEFRELNLFMFLGLLLIILGLFDYITINIQVIQIYSLVLIYYGLLIYLFCYFGFLIKYFNNKVW